MSRQQRPASSAHDATEHMASSWRARVGPAPAAAAHLATVAIAAPPAPTAAPVVSAPDCPAAASASQMHPEISEPPSPNAYGCLGCGGAACDCDFCVWERLTASVSPVPASVGMRMSAVPQATRPSPAMQQWPPPPPPLPQGPVLAPERAGRRGLRRPSPTPPSIAIPVKVPPVASAPVNEPAPDREATLRGADAEPSSQDASSAKPADAGAATPIPVVATEHSGATDDYQGLSLSDGAAGSAASSGASDRRGRQDWGRRYDAGEQSQSQAEEPQQESWLSLEGAAWRTGWSHWRSKWDSWSSWQG